MSPSIQQFLHLFTDFGHSAAAEISGPSACRYCMKRSGWVWRGTLKVPWLTKRLHGKCRTYWVPEKLHRSEIPPKCPAWWRKASVRASKHPQDQAVGSQAKISCVWHHLKRKERKTEALWIFEIGSCPRTGRRLLAQGCFVFRDLSVLGARGQKRGTRGFEKPPTQTETS